MLMCNQCGDFNCYSGEDICERCVEINEADEARDLDMQKEDELYDLQKRFTTLSLTELRRHNDLMLWKILQTCDSIIAKQRVTISNLKSLTA